METDEQLTARIQAEHRAAVVINTRARRGEPVVARVHAVLATHGFDISESHAVFDPEQLRAVLRRVIERGNRLIIVGGGDGTFTSIVGLFADQPVALGLLPLGTGNSFARALGIPLTLDGAIEVVAQGRAAGIDLGLLDGRYFADVVGIGLSADATRLVSNRMKRVLGRLAYVAAGARVLFRHHAFACLLRTDDREFSLRTHQVIVANGTFYGDTRIAAPEAISDGMLDVFILDAQGTGALTRDWVELLLGHPAAFTHMQHFTTRTLTLVADPPQHVSIDGEVRRQTPLTFATAAGALRVMVAG